MQRSSEMIGAIAAALAKAQAQLVNPEKSLVGTIRAEAAGAAERSFRYAAAVEWSRYRSQDLEPA